MLTSLPLSSIIIRTDGRQINEAAVDSLAESIAEIGLLNPVRVRQSGERWEVIAGAHRVAAYRKLGLVDIEAIVADADDLRAELSMIDENLCRAELSPSERAQQTARRKAIYIELHQETEHGGNWQSGQFVHTDAPSFAVETAAVIGVNARTVRRDAERGEKIFDGAFAIIKGTSLDTGTYLDKLKKLPPSEQVTVARRDLAWARQQEREAARKRIKVADIPLSDDEAAERQYAALVSAWNKAGDVARARFRDLIDAPVFDRSAA